MIDYFGSLHQKQMNLAEQVEATVLTTQQIQTTIQSTKKDDGLEPDELSGEEFSESESGGMSIDHETSFNNSSGNVHSSKKKKSSRNKAESLEDVLWSDSLEQIKNPALVKMNKVFRPIKQSETEPNNIMLSIANLAED